MNPIDAFQKDWHTKAFREIHSQGVKFYEGHMDPDNWGYWTQIYCMEDIKVFFQNIPQSTFLTVGDGYCGREAGFIRKFGHYVHASDWEPCLIEEAKRRGLVDDFSKQDIYKLKFSDKAWNFVFCKDTLHHLSMPYMGLYEMMRVAKNGAIIIEPSGERVPKHKHNDYEPTGNYVFTPTSHELMQIGLAYGYKLFAFTYSTVFYPPFNACTLEEKNRLITEDSNKKIEDKNIIIFFFIRDEEIFNSLPDGSKFKKFRIQGSGRNWR